MKHARIVCTGGTGTIGRRLPGEVIALKTRLEEPQEKMQAELAALGGEIGSFIHLAALTSVRQCEADPERAFELNLNGTRKWLAAAAAAGCRRFVQVSTSHVFKPTTSPEWLAPDRAPDAVSVYGRSKLAAERAMIAGTGKPGIEVAIARVFSLIAEDMPGDFLYPALQRRARERDFRPLPGYKNVRDFIEAGDVARRLWQLALAPRLDARVFHLSTGNPMSVRELAIEVMGRSGIGEAALEPMFPDNDELPNFLISRPSPIPQADE